MPEPSHSEKPVLKELILGGVRSGKSRLAEHLALQTERPVVYVATARADDAEMRQRIALHQQHRPADWTVVEEPLALAEVLVRQVHPGRCVIVDCLTLWLTQLLCEADTTRLERERQALLNCLPELTGHLILIGNETSMGIMPLGELSRSYGDEAGLLHQALAGMCDRVILTVAGLPLIIKGASV